MAMATQRWPWRSPSSRRPAAASDRAFFLKLTLRVGCRRRSGPTASVSLALQPGDASVCRWSDLQAAAARCPDRLGRQGPFICLRSDSSCWKLLHFRSWPRHVEAAPAGLPRRAPARPRAVPRPQLPGHACPIAATSAASTIPRPRIRRAVPGRSSSRSQEPSMSGRRLLAAPARRTRRRSWRPARALDHPRAHQQVRHRASPHRYRHGAGRAP
jgi:hypothetical protein